MTKILEEEKKCSICGNISRHWQLHTFTVHEDTFELDRKGIDIFPQECPCCGYVSFDLNKEADERIKEFVKTDEYKNCGNIKFRTQKQRSLYKLYLISRELKDEHGQFYNLLKASWDEIDIDGVDHSLGNNYFGKLALEHIDRLISDDEREELIVLKAELLRLNSFFDRVIEEFTDVHLKDVSLEKQLHFIVSRAKNKDCNRYLACDAEDNNVETVRKKEQRRFHDMLNIVLAKHNQRI